MPRRTTALSGDSAAIVESMARRPGPRSCLAAILFLIASCGAPDASAPAKSTRTRDASGSVPESSVDPSRSVDSASARDARGSRPLSRADAWSPPDSADPRDASASTPESSTVVRGDGAIGRRYDAHFEAGDASYEAGDAGFEAGDAGPRGGSDGALEGGNIASKSPVLFGAIRWDAWVPEMVSLGWELPDLFASFPHREPTHGWFTSNLPSEAEEQRIMDSEIDDAADGGFAYWAFIWYPKEEGQQAMVRESLDHYLASSKKKRMRFALNILADKLPYPGDWSLYTTSFVPQFVAWMQDEQYLRVDGRPVLFIFTQVGTAIPLARLDELRAAVQAAGMGPPYVVDVNLNTQVATQLHYDAVTSYGISGARPPGNGHRCFSDQSAKDLANWDVGPAAGLQTVMGLTPMNDPRPRVNWPKPYYTYWVDQPTRREWRNHVQAAIDWAAAHPSSAPNPPLALVYSWNELGEGGPGIVPTVQEGTKYLDDLRAAFTHDDSPYLDTLNGYHCAVAMTGTWQAVFAAGNRDSDEHVAAVASSTATVKATSRHFAFIGSKGPDRGKLEVFLDGASQGVIDLYSASVEPRVAFWSASGLSHTLHSAQIKVLHQKSAASSDYKVGLDAVEIQGN